MAIDTSMRLESSMLKQTEYVGEVLLFNLNRGLLLHKGIINKPKSMNLVFYEYYFLNKYLDIIPLLSSTGYVVKNS